MSPDELKALLNSMKAAAVVAKAIDDPSLQSRRGWDLMGWSYVQGSVRWSIRKSGPVDVELRAALRSPLVYAQRLIARWLGNR